jgi:heme/copper-type cytochrome/quinol oxidase subunit 4
MFVGVLVGFVLGVLLTALIRLPFADWSKFSESTAIGFGIGLAFIALGALLNLVVKFMDKQSQKVKSGGTA